MAGLGVARKADVRLDEVDITLVTYPRVRGWGILDAFRISKKVGTQHVPPPFHALA
jgi:hypothetical protein